jgi:beta-phosphoglucomutase-like phosphatase (HAD superfamily)
MRFVELLPGIGPVAEVVDVLNRLDPNAKVAVASGGLTEIVRKTLEFLGFSVGPKEKIKFLVGSDQVTHGKPAPDLFLRAAELLGVGPGRCLVFEDAEPGFLAAKAAQMDYIDVRPFRATMSAAARY